MKLFDIITEAPQQPDPKPQKTRTRSSWDDLFGSLQKGEQERQTQAPVPHKDQNVGKPGQQKIPDAKPMGTVDANKTRQRMAGVRPSSDILNKLTQMDMSDEDTISDEQARINAGLSNDDDDDDTELSTEVRSDMPANVSNAMQVSAGLVPEWHMVKNLPGYLASAIRSIGRQVFAPFTSTPIEEIQVLANLGDGPNTQQEIDAVLGYLKTEGEHNSDADLEFQRKIPNYGAKVKIYTALGYTFMVVKDFAGNYIYSWPTKDGDGLSAEPRQRRLR